VVSWSAGKGDCWFTRRLRIWVTHRPKPTGWGSFRSPADPPLSRNLRDSGFCPYSFGAAPVLPDPAFQRPALRLRSFCLSVSGGRLRLRRQGEPALSRCGVFTDASSCTLYAWNTMRETTSAIEDVEGALVQSSSVNTMARARSTSARWREAASSASASLGSCNATTGNQPAMTPAIATNELRRHPSAEFRNPA